MNTRREFLQAAVLTAAAAFLPGPAAGEPRPIIRHPRPSDSDWPKPEAWKRLQERLQGRLLQPTALTQAGPEALNPFFREEHAGATQSQGWAHAWESHPSSYAVAAESPRDVAAAVDFAREHRLRLVVKGTGHDYLGRSNAADSLLIWTHNMRGTQMHDRFVPQGAPAGFGPVSAISALAGTRWLEVYGEAIVKSGLYVQGGGCTSVGAAGGFPQGGGFGSFSKMFGSGSGGMVEAEVVTADGKIRTVNQFQGPDLFWALRGGGGGTFGVVTRITLLTHPLPESSGSVIGKIRASSDAAFGALISRFLEFYASALHNPHWGEQVAFLPDNTMTVQMTFIGLTGQEAERIWAPVRAWPELQTELEITAVPTRDRWNPAYWKAHRPAAIHLDPRSDGKVFWWAGNQAEVGAYWYTYQSRWLPMSAMPRMPEVLFEASRHTTVSLHVNKGLAGGSDEALRRTRVTSVNPVALDSFALAIVAGGRRLGEAPNPAEAEAQIRGANQAMKLLREATPGSGAYANEADYFEPDWQRSFWGVHYPRLVAIKQRYDPLGLFHCHHGVGSEGWSADGMRREG